MAKRTMILARFFVFMAVLSCASLAHSYDTSTKTILVVHSQKATPYNHIARPLVNFIKQKGFQLIEININNHEPALMRTLMQKKTKAVDLIISFGTIATRAVHKQQILDKKTPVIFGYVTDPISEGFVQGLNVTPFGNYTGVTYRVEIEDRLKLLTQLLPDARKIGFLYSTMPQSINYKKLLKIAMDSPEFRHLELVIRRIGNVVTPIKKDQMIKAAQYHLIDLKDEVDVFLSPSDQMGIKAEYAQMITRISGKPVIGLGIKDTQAPMGALASMYPSPQDAISYIKTIINGIMIGLEISDFPTRHAKSEVIVNQKTANHFNIDYDPDEFKLDLD